MASFKPYTYIQCSCFDTTGQSRLAEDASSPSSPDLPDDDDDHAFDPRTPRSSYSLYPIEYLLYCVDCNQIRCPRCVSEELVTIYCPSCLFEVGSSSVKTEGNRYARTLHQTQITRVHIDRSGISVVYPHIDSHDLGSRVNYLTSILHIDLTVSLPVTNKCVRRCTRSCFQCPLCIGPLAVQSLEPAPEPSNALLTPDNATPAAPGPWVLCCSYCNWSSSEIGVKFDKPQSIFGQLSKLRNGNGPGDQTGTAGDVVPTKMGGESEMASPRARFAAMKSFYQSQLANSNTTANGIGGSLGDYGYSSPNTLSRIMSLYSGGNVSAMKTKAKPTTIREADAYDEGFTISNLDESRSISALRQGGYDGTVTRPQAVAQVEEGPHFTGDLWPIPHLLRSKRAKRCPVCRHILSKPEAKVNNTRWRIRLVAGNYVPSITIQSLAPTDMPGQPESTSTTLTPLKPAQFLLTFKNHMFDQIKVSLATPATTPGRFSSRVTVLCPQFTIDANSDDYDINEVLREDRRRDRADSMHQVEAGKVWERGRNWVSIVVEVIPPSLRIESKPSVLRKEGEPPEDLSPLKEDEDVLEIPMFVRLEWESEASQDQGSVGTAGKEKDAKEKRELAYWCVLGLGRISQN